MAVECGCGWEVLGRDNQARKSFCAEITGVAECDRPEPRPAAACIEGVCAAQAER